MRIISSVFALLICLQLHAQDDAAGIRFFHGSFAELKAASASSGKPIFLDAYTTWCGPCKWMSKTVFTNGKVGEFYNEKFICAKFDMEEGEGLELASAFQVQAYPTLLFLNSNGEIIHQALGARDADGFLSLGRQALDPEKNLAGLKKKYRENPALFQAAYPYFQFLNESGISGMEEEIQRWFSSQPNTTWTDRSNWRMIFDFVQNPESPAFQHLVKERADFSSRYSADSVDLKLRKTYLMHLQLAARDGKLAAWKRDSADILRLKIRDGARFIASSKITLAGDNQELSLSRMMDYMKNYPSDDPDELNSYAWRMFEVSENPGQLAAAEAWAKKGLELSKGSYMIHDTYASLLFKNKKYKMAREEALKAIEQGKKEGADFKATENLLEEINWALSGSKPAAGKKR